MRQIKFRAWDKERDRMIYPDQTDIALFEVTENGMRLIDIEYTEDPSFPSYIDATIMQYTGLKDKNGVEIYEGDIITTDLERPYLIVEYRNGSFMLNCNDGLDDYYDIFFGTSEEPKEVYKYGEVIGNIYENPEMLKEEKEDELSDVR